MAWHQQAGCEEVHNFLAANHRVQHHERMARHFEHADQPGQAAEMHRLADRWFSIVASLEAGDR
jgi:hypothetical protein